MGLFTLHPVEKKKAVPGPECYFVPRLCNLAIQHSWPPLPEAIYMSMVVGRDTWPMQFSRYSTEQMRLKQQC